MSVGTFSVNPEVDTSAQVATHLDIGGSRVTFQNLASTSYGATSASWLIIPPSQDAFINRCIKVVYPITVTYTGTASGSYLLTSGRDGLRSCPNLRFTTNENISINNSQFPSSDLSWDVYSELMTHFNKVHAMEHPLACPDPTQSYSDANGGFNNPLSGWENASPVVPGALKRGGYRMLSITRDASSAVITYELIGYLTLPGIFGIDQSSAQGLTRIQQIKIESYYDFTAANVISHDPGSSDTISSVTVALTSAPSLVIKYITVPPALKPQGPLVYPCLKFDRFTQAGLTSVGAYGGGSDSATCVSNNIMVQRVPRYLFLWVRDSKAVKTITSTDTFMKINAVRINFNNQSGLLATARTSDLWLMSKQCGLLDPLPAFEGRAFNQSEFANIGTVGSIVCLEFGRHISIGDELSIGSPGSFNLNVEVDFRNPSAATHSSLELRTVVAYDQQLTIDEHGGIHVDMTTSPVGLIASGGCTVDFVKVPSQSTVVTGAGFMDFMSGINKFLKDTKLISGISGALSAVPMLAPFAGPLAGVSSSMGYGGQEMSKAQLKSMIKQL